MNFSEIREPMVMAIINATPDSFFGGSRLTTRQAVEQRVREAIAEGASVLDVGGYSSRPGAVDVPVAEEISRVAQAIEVIREISTDIAVSVDTFRSEVVRAIVERFGTIIVNDISAGELDPRMIPTVGELKLPYIAMHMRGTPQDMQSRCDYTDVTAEIVDYFTKKIAQLRAAGIENIAIDPGFGFAKSVEQNFQLLHNIYQLKVLEMPLLVGVSRKSMIWRTLNTTPDKALNGTTALNWESLRQGAMILRVHDVRQAVEVTELYKAYCRSTNI